MERNKEWLVAKGYAQSYGIDYQEMFALVAKMNFIWVLGSLTANKDWSLEQFDEKNVVLYGSMEEEVYLEAPLDFKRYFGDDKVCKLMKLL